MGQTLSEEQPRQRSRQELVQELFRSAFRFKNACFSPLEYYSLKDVFKSLADQQGPVRYLKEDTVARFLEIPDILGASPVIFQIISYIGAFPFLEDASTVLELPQMIMVIMTERYKRVLAKGSSDRTKLLFNSLAVYDRKASGIRSPQPSPARGDVKEAPAPSQSNNFKIDIPGDDYEDHDDDEYHDDEDHDEDDLVLHAYELLAIRDTADHGAIAGRHKAMIPTDNFRKLLMLLLLAAPLDPQERLSQYSSRISGAELDHLRSTAENILAAFVDAEASPGIRWKHFKMVTPTLVPNLFCGFNGLFEHFLFSQNLDFAKGHPSHDKDVGSRSREAQPLLPDSQAKILNDHILAQIAMFLPGSQLFRKVRLLYSGNEAGFSLGSFESKVFNWRAPTILLVSGTRIVQRPEGGQEASFVASLPSKRFAPGSSTDRVVFGVYLRQPWKHSHKECFGDSETVLFQLEPIHDVFTASTINTDYVTFTQPLDNQTTLSFGYPHPRLSHSHQRRDSSFALGAVSLLLNDSFEFGVFNHDYSARGGAFHTSLKRPHDFQDRFQIDQLEVWGCGGVSEAREQAERWAWQDREAEARRRINLGTRDTQEDRALLEMAGLIGGNRSGGSMT